MDYDRLFRAVEDLGPWKEVGPWTEYTQCRWCGVYKGGDYKGHVDEPHNAGCFWLEIEAARKEASV